MDTGEDGSVDVVDLEDIGQAGAVNKKKGQQHIVATVKRRKVTPNSSQVNYKNQISLIS